jgi:hypothetical protein
VSRAAKENYWGEMGGPERGPEPCRHELDQRYPEADLRPLGIGDAVNKGTFYNPWLAIQSAELLDVVYQEMRIYGSDSLLLQKGWNSLSVPLPLHSNARIVNSAAQPDILDLGTFLTNVPGSGAVADRKYQAVYEYDNTTGNWATPGALQACHGYFIKMHEPTRFPVIYGEQMNVPAYSLTADDPATAVDGWNLIGAPFGIDDVVDETDEADQGRYAVADPDDSFWNAKYEKDAFMDAELALDSIIDQNFDRGLSAIINPHVPGQVDKTWHIYQPRYDVEDLYVGEAYWAFMTDARALNGFQSAPLYFDVVLPKK